MKKASVWQKKHSLSSSEYVVSEGNALLYRITVRYLSNGLKISLADNAEAEMFSVKFPFKRSSGPIRDKRSILSDGNTVGQIFLNRGDGPAYFVIELGELSYVTDVIGYGREGLRMLFYDNDNVQKALVEHPLCVNENDNTYELTLLDDGALPVLSLFCVYYDAYYLNKPKYNNRKFSPIYCFSSKTMKESYDPDWLSKDKPAGEKEDGGSVPEENADGSEGPDDILAAAAEQAGIRLKELDDVPDEEEKPDLEKTIVIESIK